MRTRHEGSARRSDSAASSPVDPRHLDVEQGNVRAILQRRCDDLVPAGDLGHHLKVGLEPEQTRQRAPDHPLVLGDQDADHDAATGTVTRSP